VVTNARIRTKDNEHVNDSLGAKKGMSMEEENEEKTKSRYSQMIKSPREKNQSQHKLHNLNVPTIDGVIIRGALRVEGGTNSLKRD